MGEFTIFLEVKRLCYWCTADLIALHGLVVYDSVKTEKEKSGVQVSFLWNCQVIELKHKLFWGIAVWCEDFFDHLLQGHMFYWDCTQTAQIQERSLQFFLHPEESLGYCLHHAAIYFINKLCARLWQAMRLNLKVHEDVFWVMYTLIWECSLSIFVSDNDILFSCRNSFELLGRGPL